MMSSVLSLAVCCWDVAVHIAAKTHFWLLPSLLLPRLHGPPHRAAPQPLKPEPMSPTSFPTGLGTGDGWISHCSCLPIPPACSGPSGRQPCSQAYWLSLPPHSLVWKLDQSCFLRTLIEMSFEKLCNSVKKLVCCQLLSSLWYISYSEYFFQVSCKSIASMYSNAPVYVCIYLYS